MAHHVHKYHNTPFTCTKHTYQSPCTCITHYTPQTQTTHPLILIACHTTILHTTLHTHIPWHTPIQCMLHITHRTMPYAYTTLIFHAYHTTHLIHISHTLHHTHNNTPHISYTYLTNHSPYLCIHCKHQPLYRYRSGSLQQILSI